MMSPACRQRPDRIERRVEQLATALNGASRPSRHRRSCSPPDVFFDLLPPFWRFQIQGADAFIAQLRAIAHGAVTSRVIRVVADVARDSCWSTRRPSTARRPRPLAACGSAGSSDGRIAEVTCYCNGGWDDELRARHAAEAPMLRW